MARCLDRCSHECDLFGLGKWLLGFYLGSDATDSAYGAASSLITLLLWVYYSSQILLFSAEFTQVYAAGAGPELKPMTMQSTWKQRNSRVRNRWH